MMNTIQKITSLLLALTLLSLGLTGCVAQNLDPEKLSVPEETSLDEPDALGTEAPAETEVTEASTQAVTEEITQSPEELEAEKQAMIKEIYENTEMIQLPIGGWSTPAAALRDGYSGVEGSYDAVFETIASSGINFMITLEEWSSGSWPLESLSSAKKAGLRLWYNGVGQSADYTLEKVNALLASDSADALGAVYVKDEPTLDQIEALAETTAAIRAGLGEDFSLPVLSNLLPTYASSAMVGSDYRTYVRTYLDATSPDILMFDYYPYQAAGGDSLPAMMANIAIAREEADQSGIPLYTYIQSSGDANTREPSLEELNLNAHLNLAMGVKGIAYFLICEHYDGWGYTNMIDYEGQPTDMYDKIKAVNEGLNAMKGIYLAYDFEGLMLCNADKASAALSRADCTTEMSTHENGHLTSVTPDNQRSQAAVGCFTHDDGEAGYYVVNLSYKARSKITLTFKDAVDWQMWGSEGLEDMGKLTVDENGAYTLTLTLQAGEGIFLKTSQVHS